MKPKSPKQKELTIIRAKPPDILSLSKGGEGLGVEVAKPTSPKQKELTLIRVKPPDILSLSKGGEGLGVRLHIFAKK